MLSPTDAERNIKLAIEKDLLLLQSAASDTNPIKELLPNKNSADAAYNAVTDFFKKYSSIPILKLFSTEGERDVTNFIKENNNSIMIIEFLLRIKTYVFSNSSIFKDIENLLHSDDVLDNIRDAEYSAFDAKNLDVRKKYVLIIIYIYNNVGVEK